MTKGVPKVIEGIPVELLNDAKKSFERAKVRVARRNEKGQLMTVYGAIVRTIDELFEIDSYLARMSGGGEYRIEARNPDDPSHYIVPPFKVHVEGAPHKPKFAGNPASYAPYGNPQMPEPPGGHGMFDPNQPPPPPWLQGVHPAVQGYYGGDNRYYPPQMPRGRGGHPAPGATVASDQLALKELGETKAAMAEMRAELKALNDKHETETTRLRDQLADEREKAREVRHKADMEMMQQRIELAQQHHQRPPQENAAEKYAWLAPVLVAWLESNGQKSAKAIEMQQSGMKTLLEAGLQQNSKADPGMEMMKSIVMPMMLKQMDAKSPKALAELYNATTENNLNSVAMMAQLIEAFASNQENEPWWLPMVKETMNGAMGITEQIMQSQKEQQTQTPIQMRPGVPAPQQVAPEAQPAAQSAVYTTEEPQHQPQPEVTVTPPPEPDRPQTVQQAVMLGMLPKDFQTPEWKTIVLKLHNERELEKVVNLITAHLQHLIDFEMLPEMLADIVDNPEDALTRVLQPLPAYNQRKDFVEAVYSNVLLALREDGYIVLDVQGEEVTADQPEQPEQPEEQQPETQNALKTLEQPAGAATG